VTSALNHMKIESTDQDLRTMQSSPWYKIPGFQRPYSWDGENVQDFWQDVIYRRRPPERCPGYGTPKADVGYSVVDQTWSVTAYRLFKANVGRWADRDRPFMIGI
jgi:hypothetical protein